jgi:hypothetical protein
MDEDRRQEAKRAAYADLDAQLEHERAKDDLRRLVKQREDEEQDARMELEAAKRRTREAKQAHASADTDFRAHRRAENGRLQADAAAVGAKTYSTGTPCRHGHYSPRYTSSGACVMCDRIGWKDGKPRDAESHES